ncbi:MAG TPA: hypothetical protein GX692_04265 [Acholeplasmataceae bacterium]|jgi:hypothetical protein|nr:hypothetical protein [Acholeplasmataceae bacterium]
MMKFPKEKVLIMQEINDCLACDDFFGIFKLKDKILESSDQLERKIFDDLLFATFVIGNFDDVVLIASELKRKGIETYPTLYYTLLALIANEDLFQAVSIIKNSKILNNPEIKSLYQEDGANYSNLLAYAERYPNFSLLLLMVNYVNGIIREINGTKDINRDYLLFRFFDLINLIYELGYPLKIIQELSSVMKVIFNLSL